MKIETDFFVICVITMAICMYGCYLMTQRYEMPSAFCLFGMLMIVGIGIFIAIILITGKNKKCKNNNKINYGQGEAGKFMDSQNMNNNSSQSQYYIPPQYNHSKNSVKYEFKYCRKCGARIGMKSTFCPYCGDVFKK